MSTTRTKSVGLLARTSGLHVIPNACVRAGSADDVPSWSTNAHVTIEYEPVADVKSSVVNDHSHDGGRRAGDDVWRKWERLERDEAVQVGGEVSGAVVKEAILRVRVHFRDDVRRHVAGDVVVFHVDEVDDLNKAIA